MASHSWEQLVTFTTDSVGLERTFRLFHSVAQIIASFPSILGLVIYFLEYSTSKPHSPVVTKSLLLALIQRLALGRRFIRLFRFLESFHSAHALYMNISQPQTPKASRDPTWVQTEAWLDVFGRTFNGMYLLLEATTIVNALQIDGLAIWTQELERTITVEGQRFWLLSLVCGVLSGLLKMVQVMAYTPVPATGDGFSHGKVEGHNETEKEKTDDPEVFDMKKEQERLRNIAKDRKKARGLWIREVRGKIHGLGRMVVANALDIVLPGTVVGWIRLDPGTVGIAMFITTILTGKEVWERCGREVAASK
ncbi:peroxisomal biogenesis factor 11 [Pseudomassariella vexata]|uniref:Peroxisomal biogenesis factor 11 n=1 Tax=Pseudomassariella vexata TaxID=1141098 RepID=A0A1Y2DQW8_9PEZI|nr:peroxisomal biogenesis factor 11 [Pseudomassariella vexata]ORY61506.1 peroxisomal biogenesis factor 11 [Pseudomassariella vexata]